MPKSAAKGDRRERQAVELYEQAGYDVERATAGGSHSPDFFDAFDLIALGPAPEPVHLVQVKANQPGSIGGWSEDALQHARDGVRVRMLVCYDRDGWRVIDPVPGGYETVYDGREDGLSMGEGVVSFLRGEDDGE